MKGSDNFWPVILPVVILAAAALLYMTGWMWMPGFGGMSGHHQRMMSGPPAGYAGKSSPLRVTENVIHEGGRLYTRHCFVCHGTTGAGDGPAAAMLNPPPANLASVLSMPMVGDDYLFWVISEGGVSFNSAMPAFRQTLSESERWKIIHFLRRY